MPNNLTRDQYLKAMGIDVWVARDAKQLDIADINIEKNITENKIVSAVVDKSSSQQPIQNEKIAPQQESNSITSDISILGWEQLKTTVTLCQSCELLKSRKQCVFGSGNTQADLFIIGSIPNQEENDLNREFVGTEGILLDNMLRVISLSRNDVYTSNLIKCNPQQHRLFSKTEMQNCVQYLHRQIALVEPKIVLVFGEQAAQFILKTEKTMAKLTTQLHDYEYSDALIVVIDHPENLLLSPAGKKQAWMNLMQIKTILKK